MKGRVYGNKMINLTVSNNKVCPATTLVRCSKTGLAFPFFELGADLSALYFVRVRVLRYRV